MRKCLKPSSPPSERLNKHQVVSAMQAYLMNGWEGLDEQDRLALGLEPAKEGESEDVALKRLAMFFMDCADISLRRALVARTKSLGGGD
ncbi:hypothetical protein [Pseudomonas floridensis]|uniref:hypothetical protein n=1 Tax=Pseudomonas floridensis TaxID=1958950 RepID=UPI001FC9FE8F|nr:hypothetical protein [Pseudomonas floridensis]